jgi:hypothetical protein
MVSAQEYTVAFAPRVAESYLGSRAQTVNRKEFRLTKYKAAAPEEVDRSR